MINWQIETDKESPWKGLQAGIDIVIEKFTHSEIFSFKKKDFSIKFVIVGHISLLHPM